MWFDASESCGPSYTICKRLQRRSVASMPSRITRQSILPKKINQIFTIGAKIPKK